jgi:hypothetical protein
MMPKPPSTEEMDRVLKEAGFRAELSDEEQVRQAMSALKQLAAKLAVWTKA